MFEYVLYLEDGSFDGWNRSIVIAETPGKAKYEHFLDCQECWSDLTFKEYVKRVRCRKIGAARIQTLFTPLQDFERMSENRNLPFAYQGMRVEVAGKMGTIVGNYGMNLLVCFDGQWHGQNCHPWWETRYFDRNGTVIRDYRKSDVG